MTQPVSEFISQAAQLHEVQGDWLQPVRERGLAQWRVSKLPNRKTENWKYTSIRTLERGDYLAEPAVNEVSVDLSSHFEMADVSGPRVVFVDGLFAPELSRLDLPKGVSLTTFSQADNVQREQILEHLGQAVAYESSPFAHLNDSWLTDGVFLSVAANQRVENPIHVVYLTRLQENNFSVNQRLLAVLETGAEASLIEHFCSTDSPQNSFTNSVTEFVVQANARLTHYRLHLEQEEALHIGGVHARLQRDSQLNSFQIATGGLLKRLDVDVSLLGEGAHCELSGVYLPRGKQLVDFHTAMRHMVPNCTSNEIYRGIVADQSRAVFNGLIYIHPQAQKTSAQLSNKNLLTSDRAEVDTKPELQIYANDVQCAHGATVAQIDEQLLYYLCSRGIERKEAEVLLSFGFINELLNRLADQSVQEYLRPILARMFAKDPELARHIV
jgi:Fe-S cluster assembly protein SufD